MDCTITTTTTNKRRQLGASLPDTMVALGISSMVMSLLAALLMYQARSCAAMASYSDLDRYSRTAVDIMTKDLRQANRLTACTATNLNAEMIDPNTGATNTLSYVYDPTSQTLTRKFLGLKTTLLKQINPKSMKFSMYQRNPIGGTVDQYPTTDVNLCKVVQFSWLCSRTIIGNSNYTESMQSAKVVIRKD
jgi:Tfp pilus assembly protein PilW